MEKNDPRKLAMYCCQILGNVPLKDIASYFSLSHPGSVSRSIHDVNVLLESKKMMKTYKQVQNIMDVIQET